MKKFKSTLLTRISPAQVKGKETLTISQRKLSSEAYAQTLFHEASKRLRDVNHWQRYAGKATAHFQLFDHTGTEVHREAREGDFFEIDIPGPGSPAGEGKDWVEVRKLGHEKSDNEHIFFISVRPAEDPLTLHNDTAHFFDSEASSTFFIHLRATTLTAGVLGRNETPNVQASGIINQLRNLVVGIGAILGFSKLQWKALTSGLLNYSVRDRV